MFVRKSKYDELAKQFTDTMDRYIKAQDEIERLKKALDKAMSRKQEKEPKKK